MSIKVKLTIPDNEKFKSAHSNRYGEHYAYDGMVGNVMCGASKDVLYVQFSEDMTKYVACPVKWLSVVD